MQMALPKISDYGKPTHGDTGERGAAAWLTRAKKKGEREKPHSFTKIGRERETGPWLIAAAAYAQLTGSIKPIKLHHHLLTPNQG